MSEILFRWLNHELKLSKTLEPRNCARDFSNGYLLGEILHKYQRQQDFCLFLKKDTSIAKANNFTRLEPTFKLLGIPFDTNTAQDLMQEKQDVAINLLSQLFVALENKTDAGFSETVESMQHSTKSVKKSLNVQQQKSLKSTGKDRNIPGREQTAVLQPNSSFIQKIRQRIKDDATESERRGKRIDRFLIDQSNSLEARQDTEREEQMVNRLTRPNKQELLLAEKLMQIRRHKEIILENRRIREQQYQQQREKEFREALDREAVLAKHAKLAREEEIRKEVEFCEKMAAERAQLRCRKHFDSCKDILSLIVDMAIKIGEYRLLTGCPIPKKMLSQWKEWYYRGLPLLEPSKSYQQDFEWLTSFDPAELKKQEILNNLDYEEYKNMLGDWAWPKEAGEKKLPLTSGIILAYVVQRLRKIAHPTVEKLPSPLFPQASIKACALGKFCSGKTTCLTKIAEALGIFVISADTPTKEETKMSKDKDKPNQKQKTSSGRVSRKYDTVSDEVLVDMIVKAISQIPSQSGWILDGFPSTIKQARLLEEALGGSVDERPESVNNPVDLAPELDPPKPPPRPAPVLDLALLFDIPDECVVKRACSHQEAAAHSKATERMLYEARIPHRIRSFHDHWPEMKEWFGEKQNILIRVNANVDERELYSRVELILLRVMQLKREDRPAGSTANEPELTESNSRLHDDKNLMSNEENEEIPKVRCVSASSTAQLHIDEPLPPEIPEFLCSFWENVCETYVSSIKQVMQQLRLQVTLIDYHLFNIRERCQNFMKRPDLKMELVSKWQKNFNSIPDDMREDDDTKAELHLRLDELREGLWDIVDKRREEDEQERTSLMCDGLLENHSAVVSNHHSILIQEELNRFRETLCTLRTYYWSMHRQATMEKNSAFFSIPLIETSYAEDPDPEGRDLQGGSGQMDDGEDNNANTEPNTMETASTMAGEIQPEPTNPSDEKLISDYGNALRVISRLATLKCLCMPSEALQRETKELKENPPESVKGKNAKQAKKGKQSSKKQAVEESEKPPSPKPIEKTREQRIREKINKEYKRAVTHEENGAKMRILLVKAHGLEMLHSQQSRAKETFNCIEKWFQERYLLEMKCIDQLSEVVGHHIEAGEKMQYELVLGCCDFYLNGDYLLVAGTPPPCPHLPPMEKPNPFALTVAQLESIRHRLCSIAPSGLLSSEEFFVFLKDLVFNSRGRNTLPEAWTEMNERRLSEIVTSLTNTDELVDWRRFLLYAALPWPLPSLTQLLNLLRRFKQVDAGGTGYIKKEQFLQTELWFSVPGQIISNHASETLPDNRLAGLRKFFFQIFADHSASPPRLDYVSMLQYFAVDHNPRQGLIRALSVILGQHLQEPSKRLLVKSMPRIDETTVLASSALHADYQEEDDPFASGSLYKDPEVPITALLNIFFPRVAMTKDCHPLSPGSSNQEKLKQNLEHVYTAVGYEPEDCVPFSILLKHPFIQMLIETSTHYQIIEILTHRDDEEAM